MSEELQLSDAYLSLVEDVMNHALDSISEGGPLIPFVMYEREGERQMQRFMVGDDQEWDLEASVEQAREFIEGLGGGADLAALAMDGRIDVDDQMVDAILVHAYETGMESSYFFAQRYRSADDPEGFDLIGEGIVAAEDEPLW